MAKKKKPSSKSGAKKSVALEKKSEDVKETAISDAEPTETSMKASEKKASDKKASDKKSSGKKAPEKKPSVFAKIAKYFRECRSEIKKIVWPTPKATFKNVGIVLSVLLLVGLVVYGLDTGFIYLLKLIIGYNPVS